MASAISKPWPAIRTSSNRVISTSSSALTRRAPICTAHAHRSIALERLSCPVIFFQGLEDKVVPPNQAERMVAALRSKGLPVAYLAYEGEQHGFRQAKNIKRTLDAELYFYSRVYGFDLAQPVEPVTIENLVL